MTSPGFWVLFLTFFMIGMLTFGGGLGMIPIMQHEFVELHHWMSLSEFKDSVAMGLVTPGPAAIMATFIGYRINQWPGAIAATCGVFLPSVILVLLAGRFFARFEKTRMCKYIMPVVNAVVIGMIGSAVYSMSPGSLDSLYTLTVVAVTFYITAGTKISPFWPILICGLLGIIIK